MITLRPSNERGNSSAWWLDIHHNISFNRYYDPRHMGFRDLRVIIDRCIDRFTSYGIEHERESCSHIRFGERCAGSRHWLSSVQAERTWMVPKIFR